MKNKTVCFFPHNSHTLVCLFVLFYCSGLLKWITFLSYSWPWKELGFCSFLFLIISHFLVSCPFWFTLLLCTNHMGLIDFIAGVQWTYFFCWSFMCVLKYKRVDNHQSITIVLTITWLDCMWGFWKTNSRARHLVIMIQLIWAAAWEPIFLEKFAGTSDYR